MGSNSISLRYFNAAGATDSNGERHDPETHLIPLVLQAAAGRARDVTLFGTDYPTRRRDLYPRLHSRCTTSRERTRWRLPISIGAPAVVPTTSDAAATATPCAR